MCLDPDRTRIIQRLAGEYADEYLETRLVPIIERVCGVGSDRPAELLAAMRQPQQALELLYVQYSFGRRGKERGMLAKAAASAMNDLIDARSINDLEPEEMWQAFAAKLKAPDEARDRGIVQGLFELAQQVSPASICGWIIDMALRDGTIEPAFNRLVDIRGFGPKNTSGYIRDLVVLFDLEQRIHPRDRLLYQTVDKWIRAAMDELVPEDFEETGDWIAAGKLSKYTRLAGVSGARFNMGCSHFGNRHGQGSESFVDALWALQKPDA